MMTSHSRNTDTTDLYSEPYQPHSIPPHWVGGTLSQGSQNSVPSLLSPQEETCRGPRGHGFALMGLAFIYPALSTCLVVYVQKSDFHLINVFYVG